MTVVHATATRNAMAVAACDLTNSGTCEYQTSGNVKVAATTFAATAWGAASNGQRTSAALGNDTNAVGGVVAKAVLKTSGAADVMTVSVTATGGGGDITMTSVTVGAGDTVVQNALTYTAPT